MKKLCLILLPFLFIACNFSDKQTFEVKNVSSYDVQVIADNSLHDLKRNESFVVQIYPTESISIKDNNRVKAKFINSELYHIIDKSFDTITVYNSSAHDIVLYEKNDYIGTYEEIVEAKNNNKKYGVVIPANQSKVFLLYTKTPDYEAYFIENNMPAALALLSFKTN